jgi:DNA-binding SARP family transcriptional activator
VLDRLAQLHISSRRVGQCIEVAQLILRQDPSREDAHRLLMRSYAAQGRVGQVDRQFEICRRTLCEALATPPAAATVELYRTVRVEATEARGRDWSFA